MNLKNEKNAKRGFTLVEVLLVLAIVGVIAAFVIPLVVSHANKTQLTSALQKTSNTFTNVINHAQTDVKMENWNYNSTTPEFVRAYILPHIHVAKDCGMSETGCFAEIYTSNNTGGTSIGNDYYKLALTDGTAMAIKLTPGCSDENPSECVNIIVDVNALNKPNTWGKDVFAFQILGNLNAVIPYGTFESYNINTNKWEFAKDEDASDKCLNSDERYCALKIINDGWEMNY